MKLLVILLQMLVIASATSQPANIGSVSMLAGRRPNQIANLQLWLSADSLNLTNGAPVGTWPDRSGNGNDATEATNKPTFATNAFGSLPGIRFNGSNSEMHTPSFLNSSYNTNITVFAVEKPGSHSLKIWASHNSIMYFGRQINSVWYASFSLTTPTIYFQPLFPLPCTLTICETFTYDGSRTAQRINGITVATQSNTNSLGYNGLLNIGKHTPGSFFWPGDIAEVIIYNRCLTENECLSVERYLHGKYINHIPVIVFDGDSLTAGYPVTSSGDSYPDYALPQTFAAIGYNLGIVSEVVTNMTANFPTAAAPWQSVARSKNIVCFWGGSNDLFFTNSPAATYTAITNYCAQARSYGFKVTVGTIIPRLPVGPTFDADRQTLNTNIVLNWATFADGLVDLAADSRLQDPNNSTYFNTDKTHLKPAGYSVVADIAAPVISGL